MGYDVTTTDIQPSLDTVLRPNLTRNMTSIPNCPKITARELDWFNFGDGRAWLAEGSLSDDVEKDGSYGSDGFDMIFTTDTIYHPSLLLPLLSTLSSLSLLSPTSPPILLAIENRDPKLISQAITLAQEMGFSTKKISQGRVEKAVGKSGWGWGVELKGDWEGVEIWRWKFVGKWREEWWTGGRDRCRSWFENPNRSTGRELPRKDGGDRTSISLSLGTDPQGSNRKMHSVDQGKEWLASISPSCGPKEQYEDRLSDGVCSYRIDTTTYYRIRLPWRKPRRNNRSDHV